NNLLGISTSQAMSISHLNGKISILKEELENKRRDLLAEQEQSRVIKDVRTYADILQELKALRTSTEAIKEIYSVTIFPLKEVTVTSTECLEVMLQIKLQFFLALLYRLHIKKTFRSLS
ncbi:hypothetical protein AVEN_22571-1, partial [Araneus ventricosus]